MPDTGSNIIIDISGNTANMATDFALSGVGITNAHVPIQKIAFGDNTATTRVSSSDPLPITIQSYQSLTGVTGEVGITGGVAIGNFGELPSGGGTFATNHNFIKVAGSTSGDPVGITGHIQGMTSGIPVGVTGTISIRENTEGMFVRGLSGTDGFSGTFAPIRITGGRHFSHLTDSIEVTGSVVASGGRTILAATDSIKAFGSDGEQTVKSVLYRSADGATAGFSGDALKVAIVDATVNATVNVSSTHGVTNAAEPPLRIQGFTAGSGHDPVIVRGQYDGAVRVTAPSALPVSFSGDMDINDTDLINSLESSSKPLITNLSNISTNSDSIPLIRNDLSTGNFKVTVSESAQPETLVSGSKTVSTVAGQLIANAALKSGIKVKASMDNTDSIYVGGFRLANDSSAGYILEPGDSCYLNIDNAGKIYIRSVSGSQQVYYIGS
tara:strand:+ start:337 stop:1656 length:1320 start_codon:yes stop_codon:yes gene_type:complete